MARFICDVLNPDGTPYEDKKNTVYKLIHENQIPCFRPGDNGRKVMFRREEIYQWMTKRKQESTQEYIEFMDKRLLARNRK